MANDGLPQEYAAQENEPIKLADHLELDQKKCLHIDNSL